MPNMQYIDRLIKDYEEKSIRAPVPRAKKQLTDGFAK
jgi:hypothetical protein